MPQAMIELHSHLRRLGRRLRLRAGVRLATRTLWLAAALTALVEVVARLWPLLDRHLWAAAPLLLWLLSVGLYSLLRPLPLFHVARQLDTELGLKDRLATALELEAWKHGSVEAWKRGSMEAWKTGSMENTLPPSNLAGGTQSATFQPSSQCEAPLAGRPPMGNLPTLHPSILPTFQLHDALSTAQQITPQALPWRLPRRPLGLAGGLLALALGLAFIPNPMDDLLAQRAAVREAAQKQAEAIQEARRDFEKATDPTAEERAQALQALAELMKQLAANPGDLEQALADLAQAEAQLRQLQDPQAAARQTAAEQIATQLANLAQKTNQNSTAAEAAAALTELAAALGALNSAGQQELAQALEKLAGEAAPTDAELAQALSDLAAAAREGDVAEAVKAAGEAGEALARSDQAAKLQQALAQAQAQLAQSRQGMAQQGAVAQGQGQTQAPGQGQGQGQQVGSGGGTNANQLPPANRTGAAGSPTQPNKPASVTEAEKIYAPIDPQSAGQPEFVPGQETGEGQVINRQEESPLSGVNNPSLVPYQQVYQNYADAAAEAVEREQIPPDMRDLVRDYFSQLAPE